MAAPPAERSPEEAINKRFSTFMQSDNLDCFESIVDYPWNVFSVSKLHNYEPSELNLKHYAKKVRENVAGVMSSTNKSNYEIKAKIKMEKDFPETVFDEKAMHINIRSVSLENKKKYEKTIYDGYILSRGQMNYQEQLSQLPVLICRKGSEKITSCVHDILQKLFDCIIATYLFDQRDLHWLFVISVDLEDVLTDKGNIEMNFIVPQLEAKHTYSIEIEAKATRKIWLQIRENTEFTDKEVKELINGIMLHVSKVFGVNLNQMVLKSVIANNSEYDCSGQFTPKSKEAAAIILKYITNSIQQANTFNLPSLTLFPS